LVLLSEAAGTLLLHHGLLENPGDGFVPLRPRAPQATPQAPLVQHSLGIIVHQCHITALSPRKCPDSPRSGLRRPVPAAVLVFRRRTPRSASRIRSRTADAGPLSLLRALRPAHRSARPLCLRYQPLALPACSIRILIVSTAAPCFTISGEQR